MMLMPEQKRRVFSDVRGMIQGQAEEVLRKAHSRLEQYSMFHGHLKSLKLSYLKGTLRVTGQLPSYYLKQMLQTTLRDLPGVQRVENRVAVVAAGTLRRMESTCKQEET